MGEGWSLGPWRVAAVGRITHVLAADLSYGPARLAVTVTRDEVGLRTAGHLCSLTYGITCLSCGSTVAPNSLSPSVLPSGTRCSTCGELAEAAHGGVLVVVVHELGSDHWLWTPNIPPVVESWLEQLGVGTLEASLAAADARELALDLFASALCAGRRDLAWPARPPNELWEDHEGRARLHSGEGWCNMASSAPNSSEETP